MGREALKHAISDRRTRRRHLRQRAKLSSNARGKVLCATDDLPDNIPITPRELEVIETYLGGLLDETLVPSKPSS
jgi:hypothetical protein